MLAEGESMLEREDIAVEGGGEVTGGSRLGVDMIAGDRINLVLDEDSSNCSSRVAMEVGRKLAAQLAAGQKRCHMQVAKVV